MIGRVPSFRGWPSRPLRTAAISARIDERDLAGADRADVEAGGPPEPGERRGIDAEPAEVLGAALLGPAGAQRADVADSTGQGLGEQGAGCAGSTGSRPSIAGQRTRSRRRILWVDAGAIGRYDLQLRGIHP